MYRRPRELSVVKQTFPICKVVPKHAFDTDILVAQLKDLPHKEVGELPRMLRYYDVHRQLFAFEKAIGELRGKNERLKLEEIKSEYPLVHKYRPNLVQQYLLEDAPKNTSNIPATACGTGASVSSGETPVVRPESPLVPVVTDNAGTVSVRKGSGVTILVIKTAK